MQALVEPLDCELSVPEAESAEDPCESAEEACKAVAQEYRAAEGTRKAVA